MLFQRVISLRYGCGCDTHLRGNLLGLESVNKQHNEYRSRFSVKAQTVADFHNQLVEVQPQVLAGIERLQVFLEGQGAVFPLIPFQSVEHNKPEAVDHPRAERHLGRAVLERFPVVLHQVDGILVGQRHEVEILFLAELVFLVEQMIGGVTVLIEVLTDDAAVSSSESRYDFLVAEHRFLRFCCKNKKKISLRLNFFPLSSLKLIKGVHQQLYPNFKIL